MNDQHQIDPAMEPAPVSGQAARRRFLRTSGQVAIAAPAAVLLLSAAGKASADNVYTPDGAPDFA